VSKSLSFLILISLLSLVSCQTKKNFKLVNLENSYRGSGGGEYLRKPVAKWLNFDSKSKCYRQNNILYFDIKKIQESFNVDYATAIKWQWIYNQEEVNNFDKDIFFKSLDLSKKKNNLFNLPKFSKVSVYSLSISEFQKPSKSLISFLRNKLSNRGIPLIHSACFSTTQLQNWLEENELDETWAIGNEIGTNFDENLKEIPGWRYPLNQVLKPKSIQFIQR